MRRHQGGGGQFGNKAPLAVAAPLVSRKTRSSYRGSKPKAAASLLPTVNALKFVSPVLIFISFLILLPILFVIYLSLRDFNLMSFTDDYVGLGNFIIAFRDPEIGHVITNTVTYVGLSLVLETVLGFSFAF